MMDALHRKQLNPPYIAVGGPSKADNIDVPTAALAVSENGRVITIITVLLFTQTPSIVFAVGVIQQEFSLTFLLLMLIYVASNVIGLPGQVRTAR